MYLDDATCPSSYLCHTFVEGDDTIFVFGQRLDAAVAGNAAKWVISSKDDKSFGTRSAVAAWRKSKPMNTDNTLTSELDHWIFLQLPKEVKVETKSERNQNPQIILESCDKQLLGLICAKIRSFRMPEPYKGKGILFKGEVIRRKAGKSASAK